MMNESIYTKTEMNGKMANDFIAFSSSEQTQLHAFLCMTDVRKDLIQQQVLSLLEAQPVLSYPDTLYAVLPKIKATLRLSMQEWLWLGCTLTKLLHEEETRRALAARGISARFVTLKQQ